MKLVTNTILSVLCATSLATSAHQEKDEVTVLSNGARTLVYGTGNNENQNHYYDGPSDAAKIEKASRKLDGDLDSPDNLYSKGGCDSCGYYDHGPSPSSPSSSKKSKRSGKSSKSKPSGPSGPSRGSKPSGPSKGYDDGPSKGSSKGSYYSEDGPSSPSSSKGSKGSYNSEDGPSSPSSSKGSKGSSDDNSKGGKGWSDDNSNGGKGWSNDNSKGSW